MVDYKNDIVGTKIKSVTSDPGSPGNGEIWYRSDLEELKFKAATGSGAWATQTPISIGREGTETVGEHTSMICFGGFDPGPEIYTVTESWNGSSWAEVNDLNSSRYEMKGAGTSTAALGINGQGPVAAVVLNESWNGTSWTEVGDTNNSRGSRGTSGAGTSTAALITGQASPPTRTEFWNGSSWTNGPNLVSGTTTCVGDTTAALAWGGSSRQVETNEYNGTSFSAGGDLNYGRGGGTGSGVLTAALAVGAGATPAGRSSDVEQYNGTAWTTVAGLSIGTVGPPGGSACGTTSASWANFGNYYPSNPTLSGLMVTPFAEEFLSDNGENIIQSTEE